MINDHALVITVQMKLRRLLLIPWIIALLFIQGFSHKGQLNEPSTGDNSPFGLIPLSVDLVNCPAWGRCAEKPLLSFSLSPQMNFPGTNIHIKMGGIEKIFNTSPIVVVMPLTNRDGLLITYWTTNALGQPSEKRSFYFRCLLTDSVGGKYLIELLGRQWEAEAPGCAVVWNTFPEVGADGFGWQQRLENPLQLMTNHQFPLLAGRLIWSGLADASSCPNKGLLPNGSADVCGETMAKAGVDRWQNENNAAIQQAALQAYVPARLLKGLIAQESQFWPHWEKKDEFGLGMLTDLGADMTLRWNYGFYINKCMEYFSEPYCTQGYQYISEPAQIFLRGRLLMEVGTLAEYRLLGESLYAGCLQSAQLVRNIAKKEPREVASFEAMWRITMGVYHGGCGCLYDAMQQSWKTNKNFEWLSVNRHLSGVCRTAGDYFDRIIRLG